MAELTFAGNRSICLDAAISRLLEIQTRRQAFSDGSLLGKVSPWPAVIAIISAIGVADCSSTNVRLYESFIEFTEWCLRWKRPPQFAACRLHLWHPTRPDAQPFIRLLKGDDGGLRVQHVFASFNSPSTHRLLKKLLLRAQFLLKRNDPNGDLDWLQQAQREYEEAYAREWRHAPERRYRTGLKYHKEVGE
ncbi:uncharacterized protein RHO25_012874 [Cercospora beticola]|uniref:Uncharacterized protein n=1 Tax=Cercospora beticola TaxID=122368 RepID=A0ABZ0P9Q2_CERBT|nr:hypothetical protein RHO25_012874 [Cercospora beticola]